MIEAEAIIEIPFHDVDVMHIAWHGHYVKYFEIARCVLLDKIDYNYPQMKSSGFAWPVIDLRVRYAHPLHFQQKIKVVAKLVEWENRLKIEYSIHDLVTDKKLTQGYTVQVAVNVATQEMQFVSPAVLGQKVEAML
ncbi:acyl-CoA thioesterase [Methylophaga sp. OBS3]|uniref:acyl-CoA thioesterase n=1 Tax=Methylophaga sp. OBS3 TaxID=2991934 RepID=UPI002255C9DD|nr:acyl-CoA thioesterase [Methylophaga sp. OBS3]